MIVDSSEARVYEPVFPSVPLRGRRLTLLGSGRESGSPFSGKKR